MAKIKVPSHVRVALLEQVESAIGVVVAKYANDLTTALSASPWPKTVPDLAAGQRERWLLRRELQKAIQQRRLRQDGARKKIIDAAIGKPCPKSKAIMRTRGDVELEHDEYDGRPPIAVHRDWHRVAQPH
jgi:hypothetical protein